MYFLLRGNITHLHDYAKDYVTHYRFSMKQKKGKPLFFAVNAVKYCYMLSLDHGTMQNRLLKHLTEEGNLASLSKLQFVLETVMFLGHVITADG